MFPENVVCSLEITKHTFWTKIDRTPPNRACSTQKRVLKRVVLALRMLWMELRFSNSMETPFFEMVCTCDRIVFELWISATYLGTNVIYESALPM